MQRSRKCLRNSRSIVLAGFHGKDVQDVSESNGPEEIRVRKSENLEMRGI